MMITIYSIKQPTKLLICEDIRYKVRSLRNKVCGQNISVFTDKHCKATKCTGFGIKSGKTMHCLIFDPSSCDSLAENFCGRMIFRTIPIEPLQKFFLMIGEACGNPKLHIFFNLRAKKTFVFCHGRSPPLNGGRSDRSRAHSFR